jgi:hypothetical protein
MTIWLFLVYTYIEIHYLDLIDPQLSCIADSKIFFKMLFRNTDDCILLLITFTTPTVMALFSRTKKEPSELIFRIGEIEKK